ncbi:transposase [Catenulispora sp. GAS73]|uniref:transposase n=1 Tax=Catenulispora sp. GAS73 TaxID=3156269 RepID=UPI003511E0C6
MHRGKDIERAARLDINVRSWTATTSSKALHVIRRRCVVERSIGWLMVYRRLARDYEHLRASSEAIIRIAMIDNLHRHAIDETT